MTSCVYKSQKHIFFIGHHAFLFLLRLSRLSFTSPHFSVSFRHHTFFLRHNTISSCLSIWRYLFNSMKGRNFLSFFSSVAFAEGHVTLSMEPYPGPINVNACTPLVIRCCMQPTDTKYDLRVYKSEGDSFILLDLQQPQTSIPNIFCVSHSISAGKTCCFLCHSISVGRA